MEVQNDTPFVALPLRLELSETSIQGVLVVKSTFVKDAGRWVSAAEQVPMVGDKLDTAFGVFHSDGFVHKEGVDICVLGTVRTAKPMRSVELSLELGHERRGLRVSGDRRWVRRGTELVASDPLPFEELPLSYSHAYGGTTEHDYETVVHPDNPMGRGYYLSEQAAEGQLLPNIEHSQGPFVARWNDRAPIAGWAPYPQFWGLRAVEGVEPPADPTKQLLPRLRPRLNNNAHSSLIVPSLPNDATIVIRGMRPEELSFQLPKLELLAEVQVGDQSTFSEARLDGVFCWLDAERITLTHRFHYHYEYRKEERRQVRLTNTVSARGA